MEHHVKIVEDFSFNKSKDIHLDAEDFLARRSFGRNIEVRGNNKKYALQYAPDIP